MLAAVTRASVKRLQLVGVGYRAAVENNELTLSLGFSHPVRMAIPEGIAVKVEANTKIYVLGFDKCAVGNFCASIRLLRPPEPYKGKGIRYVDEVVKIKEGKKK